jgi:hypothetical protein
LWIFLPSFLFITITQLWPSNFRWITDETYHVVSCPWINACASINISAIYAAKCWPILQNFDLAIFAVVVSLAFVLAKSIHWLEHTLYFAFSTLTFSYFCCWPHQIGNMLNIYTELDFIALVGSLSGASKISSKSATPRIINNRQQQSSNGHECVQFQFLIG